MVDASELAQRVPFVSIVALGGCLARDLAVGVAFEADVAELTQAVTRVVGEALAVFGGEVPVFVVGVEVIAELFVDAREQLFGGVVGVFSAASELVDDLEERSFGVIVEGARVERADGLVAEAALEVVLAFLGECAELALRTLVAAVVGVGLDFALIRRKTAQAAAGVVLEVKWPDAAAFERSFCEEAARPILVRDAAPALDLGANAAADVVLERDFGVGRLGEEGAAADVVLEGAEGFAAGLDARRGCPRRRGSA